MAPDQPIAFGILGAAHYHAQHWLAAAVADPLCVVVGVWDDDPTVGRLVADQFGLPFVTDRQALISQSDAVGIASQTSHHAELAVTAAKAGLHVLMEKPMARTTAECDTIIEAVDQAGVVFMQNYPKRYDPAHKELVDAVHSGRLGDLVTVRIRHGNDLKLGGRYEDPGWYADPVAAGGGALIDEGVHAADLLLWIAGYPRHVIALATGDSTQSNVDITATAVFQYRRGLIAEITSSHSFGGGEASVEVYGSKGVALLSGVDLASRDLSSKPYLKFAQAGSSTFEHSEVVPGFVSGRRSYHGKSVNEFLSAVHNGAAPPVGPRDGRRSVAMIEAAYRSIKSGTRVTLDDRTNEC